MKYAIRVMRFGSQKENIFGESSILNDTIGAALRCVTSTKLPLWAVSVDLASRFFKVDEHFRVSARSMPCAYSKQTSESSGESNGRQY